MVLSRIADVVVDVGKSGARVALADGDGRRTWGGPGFQYGVNGPPEVGIVNTVAAVVGENALGGRLLVAATGCPDAAEDRARMCLALIRATGAVEAAICGDVVAAHAGAISGPGTVLSVGTGAVALAVSSEGAVERIDGWGPLLGDHGGAFDIGRRGLSAAFAGAEGRAPATVLTEAARAHLGAVDMDAAIALHSRPDHLERVAAFARIVLDAADAGDPAAVTIRREAVSALTSMAQLGVRITGAAVVSYTGRLLHGAHGFRSLLEESLAGAGVEFREPRADPLEGALILCRQSPPVYETLVARMVAG